MSLSIPARPQSKADHIVLRYASWRTYRSMLRDIEEQGGNTRLTYSEGRLEIMSPLPEHDRKKTALGRMIEALSLDRRIPIASYGSTTFAREQARRGLEPDECYYIQNEASMRGRNRIDLAVDPPPDLAVEIDISYRAIDREDIYAALGVPEVWRYDGTTLECLVLSDQRVYKKQPHSRAFPFLPVGDVPRFIAMVPDVGENAAVLAFLDWVKTLPTS